MGSLSLFRLRPTLVRLPRLIDFRSLICAVCWAWPVALLGQTGDSPKIDPSHTDPINLLPEVQEAHDRFYILDYDGALTRFEAVAKAHPDDPLAGAYVLMVIVFRELYRQDLLDTTFYAHDSFFSSKRKIEVAPDVRQRIETLTDDVTGLCDRRLHDNPNDKNAFFARGYARGMHATFATLVDHSFVSAARQGLQARNDSEAALKLDPEYTDAKLAIGVQQFAVASLPRWLRLMVGIAGVGGSKEKGLDMLREVAARGFVNSVEARTALSLFLRHDARYDEALAVEMTLVRQYPRDFLFRLEAANITKDKGNGPEAISTYRAVIDDGRRPNLFVNPRMQLAYFGLADTLRGQNRLQEAAGAYVSSATQPSCSEWLRRRSELNAGEVFDLLHQRDHAMEQYKLAASGGGDPSQSELARRYMDTPYTGR